jgi:hypothetical protein
MVHRRRRRRGEEVGEGEGVTGEVVSRSLEQGRRAQGGRRRRGGGSGSGSGAEREVRVRAAAARLGGK